MPVVGVEPTRVISTRDFEFLSASSIWCHPVISSDIWFPLCKGKIHASTNNNLKYPRFFDAFFLYSVFSVWTAQMEIGGMFRRDAGQNAPLLRHKTKGKSRIMNQNQAKEYYKKLFVNYPDVLSVEEATTLLGFKSQTAIIRRIHQHRIRCLKVGRSFMIPKEYLIDYLCNGVQREHNKKLNNGLPILHKVPPKRDYGRYFCIMAEKGGTSHGGLTEKLSPFFHAKKQEVNAYGR